MKKRPASHIIGERGVALLRALLPPEWVIREYQPDYGIDFAVEVFDQSDRQFVSLGEQFFVQLKSHESVAWINIQACARYNVEKGPLTHDPDASIDLRVMGQSIETSELQLARSMGPAVPLLLIVADLNAGSAHWVCLNDFVDKILVPQVSDIGLQASHTVYVPDFNYIARQDNALVSLRFVARRAKLYAAFNRFRYQRHEMEYELSKWDWSNGPVGNLDPVLAVAAHFLTNALAYDFWKTTYAWPAVEFTYRNTVAVLTLTQRLIAGASLVESLKSCGIATSQGEDESMLTFLLTSQLRTAFDQLANLGNMFEEICREWFLPTHLGQLAEGSSIK